MHRYLIWYLLQLKVYLKKIGYWLEVGVIALVFFTIRFMSIPESDNIKIGYYSKGYEFVTKESEFEFVEYLTEEKLLEDVLSQRLDCGFVFGKNNKEKIICLTTPLSTKDDIAKETIYSVLFREYGNDVIVENITDLYPEEADDMAAKIIEKNNEVLSSDELLNINLNSKKDKENEQTNKRLWANSLVFFVAVIYFIISERKKIIPYFKFITYLSMLTPLSIMFLLIGYC